MQAAVGAAKALLGKRGQQKALTRKGKTVQSHNKKSLTRRPRPPGIQRPRAEK